MDVPPRPASPPIRLDAPTERQISRYLFEMCAELRDLAGRHRLRTVAYLLDMARLESERVARLPLDRG